MNISKDKIDQLFSEKLEHFEVKPRAQAWDKLENKIKGKNKNRVIGWYRYAIAASVALILFVGGLSYFNNFEPINTQPKLATNTSKVIEKESINYHSSTNTIAVKEKATIENSITKKHFNQLKNFNKESQSKEVITQDLFVQNEVPITINPIIETKIPEQIIEDIAENIPARLDKANEVATQKAEDLTIIFTVANFEKPTMSPTINDENMGNEKKSKYLTKLYRQLINAKNGDKVDWNEVGFKPAKILARAENKLKQTKNEINDSYQSTKNKTVF